MALEAICKSVPPELQEIMANKPCARTAWEDLKTANLGVERVRRAKADTLRREFDSLVFKDGESIDKFSVRINGVVQKRRTLGDEVDEVTVVRKFLQALPPRYHQIAMSIETLLNVEDVPVEELVGHLKAAEERHALIGGGTGLAQLNLTEDELVARLSKRLNIGADKGQASGSSSASWGGQRSGRGGGCSKSGRGGGQKKGGARGGHGDGARDSHNDDGAHGGNSDVGRDECRYCGLKGHWARECPKRKHDLQAHAAQVEEEQEHSLLVAAMLSQKANPSPSPPVTQAAPPAAMHLNEDKLYVQLGEKGDGDTAHWILDMGATNHMTGARSVFSELNSGVHGSVRFGDGSTVDIEGRGTVLLRCKTGEHQRLTDVYHIPRLTANIISLGQLEEEGFKILLENGALKIWDPRRRLVVAVQRGASRLYILNLTVDKPVCLVAHIEEASWRWHADSDTSVSRGCRSCRRGRWCAAFRGLSKLIKSATGAWWASSIASCSRWQASSGRGGNWSWSTPIYVGRSRRRRLVAKRCSCSLSMT
jgi:hypothetical protein